MHTEIGALYPEYSKPVLPYLRSEFELVMRAEMSSFLLAMKLPM
jgi:hypothetical protein